MAIRTKLAIWFSILVAVVLTLVAVIRYTGYKKLLQRQKDYSLKVVADILDSSIPRRTPSKNDVQMAVSRMIREYPDIESKGFLIEVYDPSRSVIYVSSISEAERFPVTDEMWEKAARRGISLTTLSEPEGNISMRILTKPLFLRDRLVYIIQIGSSTQDIETTLDNLLMMNLLLIPTTTLLIGIGGWYLTRWVLKPIEEVIDASHSISSGNLQHRIELSGASSEIRDLTGAFNQMIARLDDSFKQIQYFSENVSHELRIPLSILRGQTELALKRFRSGEEYRKTLESNLEEILRMEKIVERLLFLSKADRGEIKINRIEIDLSSLLKSVCEKFQLLAREKDINIVLKTNGPVQIIGDELLLRELLFNLIQNAITYTEEGGQVVLSVNAGDKEVSIFIADTGCGIPADEIPHIFERFYQVDKSRSSQGSGLGLSICKWIAESHNGRIAVESIVGKGSLFEINIPVNY